MATKRASRQEEMMAALARTPIRVEEQEAPAEPPQPAKVTEKTSPAPSMPPASAAKGLRGKPMNLYLHPEDMQRIRSLSAYLTGQGFRVSDSQVVKAALRAVSADQSLLSAYEEAVTADQRYKRNTAS